MPFAIPPASPHDVGMKRPSSTQREAPLARVEPIRSKRRHGQPTTGLLHRKTA